MKSNNKIQPTATELRLKSANAFASSTLNILLISLFSLLNLILLLAKADIYLLFSAMLPYAICDFAMYVCGKYPDEYYLPEELAEGAFLGDGFFYAMIVIALLCIAAYFVCWLLAKKFGVVWHIVALAMLVLDTVFMFVYFGFDPGLIISYLIHIYMIVLFIVGIVSYFKLKKLPPPENDAQTASPVEMASPVGADGSSTDAPSEATDVSASGVTFASPIPAEAPASSEAEKESAPETTVADGAEAQAEPSENTAEGNGE